MNLRSTLDSTAVQQRVESELFAAARTQLMRLRSIPASVVAAAAVGPSGMREQCIQLLRDRYDRNSEAYLNGAIGEVEYQDIVRQINEFMSVLVAPQISVTPSGHLTVLPAPNRKDAVQRKVPHVTGDRKPGADAESDADFAAIVQSACVSLAGQN